MSERGITIVLRARNAMQRGLGAAGKALQSFGKTAMNVGKFFAKTFLVAGTAVAGFTAKALSAHARQQKAVEDLRSSLNAYGDDAKALMPILQAQADAIQNETGASNDQTLAKMAQLRVLGVMPERLGAAYKGVIALEQAGVGLNTALRGTAAAMQGNFSMLTRYIPALRNAKDETEQAQIVNDFMVRGYKTAQDRLDTVAGRWTQLKNRVDDAWKAIGAAVDQNEFVVQTLHRAGEAVLEFGNRVAAWVEGGGVKDTVDLVRNTFENMRITMQKIADQKVNAFVVLLTGSLTALSIKLLLVAKKYSLLSINAKSAALALWHAAAAKKAAGLSAMGAAAGVKLLSAAMLVLQAIPIVAVAAGFAAIAKAALDANEATKKLQRSMEGFADTEAASIERWGVGTRTLRQIREAIEGKDADALERLTALYPEAVARAQEHLSAVEDTADALKDAADAADQIIIPMAGAGGDDGDRKKALEDFIDVQARARDMARMEALEREKVMAADRAEADLRRQLAAVKAEATEDEIRMARELAVHGVETADAMRRAKQDEVDAHRNAVDEQKALIDELRNAQQQAAREEVDIAKHAADEKRKVAEMTVQDFIDAAKADEDTQKKAAREARRMKELEERQARGVTLSRRDQMRLDAFRQIQAAKDGAGAAAADVKAAQARLEELQGQQVRALNDIKDDLRENGHKMNQLLQMR